MFLYMEGILKVFFAKHPLQITVATESCTLTVEFTAGTVIILHLKHMSAQSEGCIVSRDRLKYVYTRSTKKTERPFL